MSNQPYPKLAEPIVLAGHTIRNRTLMGSMHTGLEECRGGFKKAAVYYAARAKGGVGLIVTGGVSPNLAGRVSPFACTMSGYRHVRQHKLITEAVHEHDGKIIMQILHAGRYAFHPLAVAPSRIKSPISPFKPRALSTRGVERTIKAFVRCAKLAKAAGYDGVEVMGSEGYLINQFIVSKTNQRKDRWGGDYQNRMQFPVEIIRRIRAEVGDDFILMFRLSMLDLVEGGSTWPEIVMLGKALQAAGTDIINTGIGWHEARVPTIATRVPRAAFTWVTERIRPELSIPVVTANRINMPDVAEKILADNQADMVSMARPFLADPEFANKAFADKAESINTCIACNQACLDHVFQAKRASCLVNPQAAHETELVLKRVDNPKKIAVVGAGPAGMSAALAAAKSGHFVTLYEAEDKLGGQFNLAKVIPGKEEYAQTIRYFANQLSYYNVKLKLATKVSAADLTSSDCEEVILASGITPRTPNIPGIDGDNVMNYIDVLTGKKIPGQKVAIIGAGGIGFDVAEFLTHEGPSPGVDIDLFLMNWGIDRAHHVPGAVAPQLKQVHPSPREVYLLQRKKSKIGAGLGKTTGWAHRLSLKDKNVQMMNNVQYEKIDKLGLHISVDGKKQLLRVDTVVVCAGQVSATELQQPLESAGLTVHLIGGAKLAAELDAKRAIEEGVRLFV